MTERIVISVIVAATTLWIGWLLRRNWRRGRCAGCKGREHCSAAGDHGGRDGG